MFHFLKYFLILLFLAAFYNLFWSNQEVVFGLQYKVPYVGQWLLPNISFNFFLLLSFGVGFLTASFIGALRIKDVHQKKKELKRLKAEVLQETKDQPLDFSQNNQSNHLPPLSE